MFPSVFSMCLLVFHLYSTIPSMVISCLLCSKHHPLCGTSQNLAVSELDQVPKLQAIPDSLSFHLAFVERKIFFFVWGYCNNDICLPVSLGCLPVSLNLNMSQFISHMQFYPEAQQETQCHILAQHGININDNKWSITYDKQVWMMTSTNSEHSLLQQCLETYMPCSFAVCSALTQTH